MVVADDKVEEKINRPFVETIQSLLEHIGELKEEQVKTLEQVRIALELTKGTDNLDNLRLICDDLGKVAIHIIEKDQKLHGDLESMLKDWLVILDVYKTEEIGE